MSLEHAILGFLSFQPLSGYTLKRRFDRSVQHFWPATQSQIYRSLSQMADQGWLRMTVIDQEDRPDRKEYAITPAGQAELHRWLTHPLDMPSVRNAWLMQLFFAHQISNEELATLFQHYAEQLRRRIAEMRDWGSVVIQEQPLQPNAARARQFWQLTLEYGRARLEWELHWAEHVLATIRQLDSA